MAREFNDKGAVFYPPNDAAASMFVDRISSLFDQEQFNPENINDAIELHQCSLTAGAYPKLFSSEAELLNGRKKAAHSAACKYLTQQLESRSLQDIHAEVEIQYSDKLFELLFASGAYGKVSQEDMAATLKSYPRSVYCILQKPALAEKYKTPIREFLIANPSYGAEFLIGQFGSQTNGSENLIPPKSLSNDEIDSIMLAYLQMDRPNLNYIRVLLHWPVGISKLKYTPSKEVMVEAERKEKQLNDELFERSSGIAHSIEISTSFEQKACKGLKITESGYKVTYGAEWLSTYTDPGTILNNFVFLFDYIDSSGRLSIPAHQHENSTILDLVGLHALNEYKSSIFFRFRNYTAITTMSLYRNFLAKLGIRIEDALQWVFDSYFPSELNVEGFALNLPTEGTSTLDKCKAIGPEVERLLLTFALYAEKHEVDPAYLPYMTFNGFSTIPSLMTNKYVEAGQEFLNHASPLFSDQSLLAFSEKHREAPQQFFGMIVKDDVRAEDFHEVCQPLLDRMAEDGTIVITEDGIIKPTREALILKEVWRNGAIEICKYCEEDKAVANRLVSKNWLRYSSMLFSTDEANYLSYMFNDAMFSNALGLRNKYDHGNRFIDDPESPQISSDYSALLMVLVCVILKINDDLSFAFDVTGIDELVDWPWLDDSTIEAAKQIELTNRMNRHR